LQTVTINLEYIIILSPLMIYTNSKWEKYIRTEDWHAYVVTWFAKIADDPKDEQASKEEPQIENEEAATPKQDALDSYAKNYSPFSKWEWAWISPESFE